VGESRKDDKEGRVRKEVVVVVVISPAVIIIILKVRIEINTNIFQIIGSGDLLIYGRVEAEVAQR